MPKTMGLSKANMTTTRFPKTRTRRAAVFSAHKELATLEPEHQLVLQMPDN